MKSISYFGLLLMGTASLHAMDEKPPYDRLAQDPALLKLLYDCQEQRRAAEMLVQLQTIQPQIAHKISLKSSTKSEFHRAQKAAKLGDGVAMYTLAALYRNGFGGARKHEGWAQFWYAKADAKNKELAMVYKRA